MNFSDFCQPFYNDSRKNNGIRSCKSQAGTAEFFLKVALGEASNRELAFTSDYFRKFFKGEREPKSDLWKKIVEEFDEVRFSRKVSMELIDVHLCSMMTAFGIILNDNDVPDKFAFSSLLAKQFLEIASGNGEAENIVSTGYQQALDVEEFPLYIKNATAKYSKLKTLLYSTNEHDFYDFFVCNHISKTMNTSKSSIIENATLEKLLLYSQYVLLSGMGGIGKSMMMRHMFLSSIKKCSKGKPIPILVTLREFNDNTELFDIIVDSVHRFDTSFSAAHIHKLMLEGRCQLLLDGLDEIRNSELNLFQKQLDSLIDRYPKNQFVISTRKFSSFIELSRFMVLFMVEFTRQQSLELIDKLEFCPEEPKLKQKFRENLICEYFHTHKEFVTNPLLLTLMLMNYRRFSDIPEKKHLFYEQAYQTLLWQHDSDKLAYRRVFLSVTDVSDFTLVFREFCAKSYRKGDYEFDRKKFEEYFNSLKSIERLDSNLMKLDNFIFDICNSACLMYEEGQTYHFLHRSFQEYFFADYYSRQSDNILVRLGKFLDEKLNLMFDDGEAFSMLYDLAPDKVERFIFLPFLDKIFSKESVNEQYWEFLEKCYKVCVLAVANEEIINDYSKKYNVIYPYEAVENMCVPSSVIYSIISKLLHQKPILNLGSYDCDIDVTAELCQPLYGNFIEIDDTKEIFILPLGGTLSDAISDPKINERFLEGVVKEDNGEFVEFGKVAMILFETIHQDAENHKDFITQWENEMWPARKPFNSTKRYYQVISKKYANIDELDDDDF